MLSRLRKLAFGGVISLGLTGLVGGCASGPVPRQDNGDMWWQQVDNSGLWKSSEGWAAQREIMLDRIKRYTKKSDDTLREYDNSKEAALTDGRIDSNERQILIPLLKEAVIAQQGLREYAQGVLPILIDNQQPEFYATKIKRSEDNIDRLNSDYKTLTR
jgi:hypothetical protein